MKTFFVAILVVSTNVFGQVPTTASGEYFRDFGRLIGEIRSVRWSTELCGESFPEKRAPNEFAYAEWRAKYRPFLEEMENQFQRIEAYWKTLPPKAGAGASSIDMLKRQLESQREPVRQQFLNMGVAGFASACSRLPDMLRSERYNLEKYRNDLVSTVRQGPPPFNR